MSIPVLSEPGTTPPRHQSIGRYRALIPLIALPAVIVLLLVIGTLSTSRFLSVTNLTNVLNSASITGIVAIGMTLVLLVGGLVDLSVPATVATGGIVTLLVGTVLPPPLAFVAGVLAATAAGVINGVLIGQLEINPVVATLGTNVIILGIAQTLIGGRIIYAPESWGPDVKQTVTGSTLGVPFGVIVLLIVAILAGILLSRSTFGRRVYATGGNRGAALIAGTSPRLITATVFVVSALCAGIAGSLLALQLGSVRPGLGEGFEFDAITAVVVGGTSLFGGAGSVWRTFGGILIVALTSNILNLVGVPTSSQGLIKGAVIVAAVGLDVALRFGRRKR